MDTMPVAVPPPADPQVLLMALAKAAAEMAAREAGKRSEASPITREDVEDIAESVARRVIEAVFAEFDVDLTDKDSKREFREDIGHVRRGRAWWNKAWATLFTAVMTALSAGLIAAVVKYLSIGGGK